MKTLLLITTLIFETDKTSIINKSIKNTLNLLYIYIYRKRNKHCGRITEKTPSITHRCVYLDFSSPGPRCFSSLRRSPDVWTRSRGGPGSASRPGRVVHPLPTHLAAPARRFFAPGARKTPPIISFFPGDRRSLPAARGLEGGAD